MSHDIEQYRPGFEAWATGEEYDLLANEEGDYFYCTTEHAWAGYLRAKSEDTPGTESVPVPTTVNMARMMLALGHRYLSENAPEHLAKREASTESAKPLTDEAKDAARLDFIDEWVRKCREAGQAWATFTLDTKSTAREQIDAEIAAIAHTKAQEGA